MKSYKVFKHPDGSTEAVKQGWSWPAFFFGFIWAFVKKLWALGAGVLIAIFMLGFILGLADAGEGAEALINIVAIIINVVFGVNGNQWRSKNLLSRGFEQVDTLDAANPDEASALFLKARTQKT